MRIKDARHIANQDPARTLAMVAAHRKILDDYASYRAKLDRKFEDDADSWHFTGQGYVWHKLILALAEGYGITAQPS
jgi:hypothetical protein